MEYSSSRLFQPSSKIFSIDHCRKKKKKRRIVTKEVTFIITSGTLDRINHSVANEAVEQKALCDKEASLRPRGGIIYLPGAS